jgi:hypothetical protein
MKNSVFIRNNYKSSTIPRLLDGMGFKTIKEINDSEFLTYLLETSSHRYIQDELFNRLFDREEKDHWKLDKYENEMLKSMTTTNEQLNFLIKQGYDVYK